VAKAKRASSTTNKKNKKPGEILVVGSKVKAALKEAGCNTGGDVIESLNFYVQWLVDQAAKRAMGNKRKTVRGYDIFIP
jgi:hypothetical protein